MRAPMAVRLDIRPRLTLPREPVAKVQPRRQLPPLTLPAVGYWLAMGALTYFFAHLDEPLFETAQARVTEPADDTEPTSPVDVPVNVPVPDPAPPPLPTPDPGLTLAHDPAPVTDTDSDSEVDAQPDRGQEREPELRRERRTRRATARRDDRLAEVSERFESREPEPPPALSLPSDAPRLTFPEFSDSSRPRERERAGGGPRIDSDLFGDGRRSPPRDEAPGSAPPESDSSAPAVGTSCEAAMARNKEEITIGGARGPADITRDAYAAILENGRYLSGCSIPERTVFQICAAVQNGRAIGITVVSNPRNAGVESCVRRAVSRLKFPANSRLDVTHTRFDAARR
jgi:hypothetical protein